MAGGEMKAIADIMPGEFVQGRWQVNQVRGIEKPMLGGRDMYLMNNTCFNTGDHPVWTEEGWQVVDKKAYVANDWQAQFILYDNYGGSWFETYQPCLPEDMGALHVDHSMLAVPGGAFEKLESLEAKNYPPGTQLYALALTGDRTMFVDGYCFSGWADIDKFDYQARIGT